MDLGSLDGIYKRFGAVPENIVSKIAVHALRGLQYLTEKNIVHRGTEFVLVSPLKTTFPLILLQQTSSLATSSLIVKAK